MGIKRYSLRNEQKDVCMCQPGFSSSTMRFHSIFSILLICNLAILLLLKDQGVALGHSGMHVENSLRHHMRSISIVEAGIWSAQGVTFWMMDRRAVYGWPLHERICPQPCFRNSRWSQSTTVWTEGISQMKFLSTLSTLSNSLWKNYLDYLDCIDHL